VDLKKYVAIKIGLKEMKQEINPKDTNRAIAFELWTKSPMPMVTLTKTFDVTHLRKVSRKRGMKFNMLLCWCIGKAASTMAPSS
jgi:chloramphenicol O-acetyltransferase type A